MHILTTKLKKTSTKALIYRAVCGGSNQLIQIIHESDLNQIFLAETFYLSQKL